ncbi:unnamed protein product, partial [Adineta steineri]
MNRNINKLKRLHSKNNDVESSAKRQFHNETEKRRRDLFTQLITNLRDILLIKKPSDTNEENTKLDRPSILYQTATFLEKHKQIYISKNIHSYFGYSQDELVNHALLEFILPSNHDQLLAYLSNNHQVLQTCDISWKRAVDNDYEQCTLIGAYRTINENENYFMSIVKINTSDRMLRMNYADYPTEEFITYLNIQGKFVYIDSKARQ